MGANGRRREGQARGDLPFTGAQGLWALATCAPLLPLLLRLKGRRTPARSREQTARAFFEACETGKGWDACEAHCQASATFACQADALAEVTTLAAYTEWMKGLLTPVPDGRYQLTAFALDEARGTVAATAEFQGTRTGTGGPVAPTGRAVVSHYAYVMQFDGDKIAHMTKIWNDARALHALGWA